MERSQQRGGAAGVVGVRMRQDEERDAAAEAPQVRDDGGTPRIAAGPGAAGVPWRRVHPGDSIAVDGVVLRVLAPDSAWTASLADPNEASVVTTVEYRGARFLLTGDAERGEEDRLIAAYGTALRADVLKVGHHGSSTSSSPEFLSAVRPRLALISVGVRNSYGHPSPSVLRALTRAGAAVLRTDAEGTLVVRTDGATIEVEDGGERWTLARGPP